MDSRQDVLARVMDPPQKFEQVPALSGIEVATQFLFDSEGDTHRLLQQFDPGRREPQRPGPTVGGVASPLDRSEGFELVHQRHHAIRGDVQRVADRPL